MQERHRQVNDESSFERVAEVAGALEWELAKAIVGQQRVVREILIAFLAGGHCLLRGVPGLAKTLLIAKLAEAVDLKFNRVQFTPDLMPSDILGADVIEDDRATGKRVIRFGMYSAAFDAWRHRASGGFARFWEAQVAAAASGAPRRIDVAMEPGLASPGQIVTLRVHVRETEFSLESTSIRLPMVSATRTDRNGAAEPIRLWPTAEAGLFEGRFSAPPRGSTRSRYHRGAGSRSTLRSSCSPTRGLLLRRRQPRGAYLSMPPAA